MKELALRFAKALLSQGQMRAIKGGGVVYCSCCGTPHTFNCSGSGNLSCASLCAKAYPGGCGAPPYSPISC
jgi:hypothetical protein